MKKELTHCPGQSGSAAESGHVEMKVGRRRHLHGRSTPSQPNPETRGHPCPKFTLS